MTEPASPAAELFFLPCTASSVGEARQIARDQTADLMCEEQRDRLMLVLSEVVSNAVRHSQAEQDVKLAITPKEDYLCVRVTDAGTGLVPRPGAIESESGAGFGLFLVEQLTRRWGMTREDERTRVWFEIDLRR